MASVDWFTGGFLWTNRVELETDNAEVLKEWEDWRWFISHNHSKVIQQPEQRKKDPSLTLRVKLISVDENKLARYLAIDGGKKQD